jgi:hypothetical protein
MQYESRIERSRIYGWQAKTEIPLETFTDESEGGKTCERVLKISTSKGNSRQVTTFASICVNVPCNGYAMQKHALFGDYARTIARHAVTKATEKAIREAHLTALESVPAVIEEARAANWKAIR